MKYEVANPQDNYMNIKGIYEMKESDKGYTFTWQEDRSIYQPEIKIIKCRKDNQCNNMITKWDDGDFTIYINRNGIPIYFKKLN